MQETGPTVHSPLSRKLECLTDADVIIKAAHSPLLFQDPEYWSGPWARILDPLVSCMRAMSRMSHGRQVKSSQDVYDLKYPLGSPVHDF